MLKKWFKQHDLLKGLIYALAAVVICVITITFFVAWIAWRSGAPIPVT